MPSSAVPVVAVSKPRFVAVGYIVHVVHEFGLEGTPGRFVGVRRSEIGGRFPSLHSHQAGWKAVRKTVEAEIEEQIETMRAIAVEHHPGARRMQIKPLPFK